MEILGLFAGKAGQSGVAMSRWVAVVSELDNADWWLDLAEELREGAMIPGSL